MEAKIDHPEMQEEIRDNDPVTQLLSLIWLIKYGDLWTIKAVYRRQSPKTQEDNMILRQPIKKEAMKPIDSNPGKNCEEIKGYNNTKEH